MTIAELIMQMQDKKEMVRRAIKILENAGENTDDLRIEFIEVFGEEV